MEQGPYVKLEFRLERTLTLDGSNKQVPRVYLISIFLMSIEAKNPENSAFSKHSAEAEIGPTYI